MISYRHCGGDIFWGPVWISDEEIQRQLDLVGREAEACKRIGDATGYSVARSLFLEITDAVAEQAKWKRCASASRNTQAGRAA